MLEHYMLQVAPDRSKQEMRTALVHRMRLMERSPQPAWRHTGTKYSQRSFHPPSVSSVEPGPVIFCSSVSALLKLANPAASRAALTSPRHSTEPPVSIESEDPHSLFFVIFLSTRLSKVSSAQGRFLELTPSPSCGPQQSQIQVESWLDSQD